MGALEAELIGKLALVHRYISALEEKSLEILNINLTLSEIHLVALLARCEEDITVSDVAFYMGITRPSATVAIGKIVKKGYAVKETTPIDARKITVKLTRYGRKINELYKNHRDTALENALSKFEEEEKINLLKGIDKFSQHLSKAY